MRAEGGGILATTPRAGKQRAQESLTSGALQEGLFPYSQVCIECKQIKTFNKSIRQIRSKT